MTDENQHDGPFGDSRRSFMKKSALAAGAVALGSGTMAGSAAAQDADEALVFSYDYFPGAEFDVLSELEQGTTDDILRIDDEEDDAVGDPSDWNGHVIRCDLGGDTAGMTTFLFTENGLSEGDSGTLGTDAQMFSSELNLLEVSLNGNDNGNGEDDNGDGEDDNGGNGMENNETDGNTTS